MISIGRHFPIERPIVGTISFVLVLLAITVYTVPYIGLSYAQTTFPPPVFLKLRDILSYAITIPFSSSGLPRYAFNTLLSNSSVSFLNRAQPAQVLGANTC